MHAWKRSKELVVCDGAASLHLQDLVPPGPQAAEDWHKFGTEGLDEVRLTLNDPAYARSTTPLAIRPVGYLHASPLAEDEGVRRLGDGLVDVFVECGGEICHTLSSVASGASHRTRCGRALSDPAGPAHFGRKPTDA